LRKCIIFNLLLKRCLSDFKNSNQFTIVDILICVFDYQNFAQDWLQWFQIKKINFFLKFVMKVCPVHFFQFFVKRNLFLIFKKYCKYCDRKFHRENQRFKT
ncbi:hypothetical protein M153_154320003, partial [Pseudoloma neurophilia]